MNTDERGKEMPDSALVIKDVCKKCGGTEFEMRNYSMVFHDGDIHCVNCGEFLRDFDAG